ncbi:MAG: glycosyltransferase family 4 protein, partial [bacterium]|nr:glycosyltransferase family 4 protein [bacterium]
KLIPNGIDLEKFQCKSNPKNIRDYFDLPHDCNILLSVGREQIYKNYHYGIKAIEILEHQDYNLFVKTHYIIIGKDVTKHKDTINTRGLSSQIHLLETLPQDMLVDCYQTSDIFLQTSIIESFGLVSIEAFACGLPVIATDVPGNNDVVNDNVGFCVDIKDPQKMTEKIEYLLNNREILKQLRKNGIKEVQQYRWNKIIDQYKRLYDELTQVRQTLQ